MVLENVNAMSDGTNCSVHGRCIWELSLEGAKSNADLAIHRMERAEIENHQLRTQLQIAVEALRMIAHNEAPTENTGKLSKQLALEALEKIRGMK